MEPKKITLEDGATPRKVVATSKGSAKHYNDGGFEYSPYESTGESNRENVVRKGDSVTYVTKGKKPYRVVTLKVKDDDPALCSRMQEELNGFIEGFGKKTFKKSQNSRRTHINVLWDAERMRIELSQKEQSCYISIRIPLGSAEEMKQLAFENLMDINRCFTINKQPILRAFRAAKKNSEK